MPRRITQRAINASVILSTLMLAAGLSGCGKTDTSASLMADAKQYQQKGDTKAALIQMKNAAAKSPEDAEVRFQLASLYNELNDPVSAEKEIRKATSLGMDSARTLPVLAKALQRQGMAQKVLDESAPLAAKASPELLTIRADSYVMLKDTAKAKQSYQQALAAKPGDADALMGLAKLAMFEKDTAGALGLIDQAVAANPKNAAVWLLKGSLLQATEKTDAAGAAFSQAIVLDPELVAARLERATLEMKAKQFDAAKADIDVARKVAPNALPTIYSQALLDFSQGKFAAANESLQKLLKAAPDHLPSIVLAAAVELNLGSLQQAEQHAKKYLSAYPDNAYGRKLLAQIQLKNAQPGDAATTLAPLMKDNARDPYALALAGESSMQTRDFKKASQYFSQASLLEPKIASLHTSLGLSKLQQGDPDQAVAELERATVLDPQSSVAGVALVRTEMNLKHFDKALAAAKALVAAHPNDATMHNLLGAVYLGTGERSAARVSFDKAVSLQPTMFAAVMNLARLDMLEQKPDAAKQRLVAFLDKDKKNTDALMALAALAMTQKQPAEATTWLERASTEHPEAVGPAIQLAAQYMRTNQAPKALLVVRKVQTANPTNPELLDLLGQTQLANQDPAGALETFSKLASVMPKSAAAQMRMATAHIRLKNEAAATADLKKALVLEPNFNAAKLALIDLSLAKGNNDQALLLARQIQKSDPVAAVGYVVEGDVMMRSNKAEQAIRPYDQAFSIAKSPQTLVKLVVALNAANKKKEADAKMADWQKAHPNDPLVATYAGEMALQKKQYKVAAEQFEASVKAQPDNPVALNNLAVVYQELKDPRAVATAEHALKLAPDSPNVMDTLGWMLVQQGNVARGLPLLQKAVALQPGATEIRFHLAVALEKSGDKKKARQELDKLLSDNKPFPQIDEARAMLKIL